MARDKVEVKDISEVNVVEKGGVKGEAYANISTKFHEVNENMNMEVRDVRQSATGKSKLQILQESMAKMHEAIRRSGKPNFQGCRFPVYTKIDVAFLEKELSDYEDKQVVELIKYGFPINYEGTGPGKVNSTNHKGAVDFPEEIDNYLEREVRYTEIRNFKIRNQKSLKST